MTACAPRYDPRLVAAIVVLDDPALPIAETVRRVGVLAERLGLTRPSYVHVRRYVLDHRQREAAARARLARIRELLAGAYWDPAPARPVEGYELLAGVGAGPARQRRRAPPPPARGSESRAR